MIELIRAEERLAYKLGDSRIFYRRVSIARRRQIIQAHTRRGVTDWQAVTGELLAYVVTGWDNVGQAGQPVAFSLDKVADLPDEVAGAILDLAGAASGEDAQGN